MCIGVRKMKLMHKQSKFDEIFSLGIDYYFFWIDSTGYSCALYISRYSLNTQYSFEKTYSSSKHKI